MAVETADPTVRTRRHARWRFTAEQYLALCQAGVLPPDARTELIAGEVYAVPPPGPRHGSSQVVLTRRLIVALSDRWVVWLDNAIRLADDSVVQPDVTVVRPERALYSQRLPSVDDTVLVVEIADSTLAHDRRHKLPLYARHGVPEVWLVDLTHGRIEVHRTPDGRRYRDITADVDGEAIAPQCAPDVAVDVGEVLRVRADG